MTDRNDIKRGLVSDVIATEAASWIAQIDSEEMTNADRLALREWAARSPRHLAELKQLGQMWCDIDALLDEDPAASVEPSITGVIAAGVRLRPVPIYAALATCAALVIATFALLPFASRLATPAVYEVALQVDEGKNEVFELNDGSTVHLNTDSLVEVSFDKDQREVRLVRGEAMFNVSKDPDRPFIVYAGGSAVKAVGTAFSVRVDPKDTFVMVTEGVVEFSSLLKDAAGVGTKARTTLLQAGHSVTLSQSGVEAELVVKTVSAEQINHKLAWREGLLIFDGDPLTDVVDEVSRYTAMSVIISDPEIRNIPIGGVFEVGEVNALLGALESSFGIEVKRVDQNLVYLSKRREG